MRLSRRGWIIAAGALLGVLAIASCIWIALGPPRVDMATYAPESSMLFVEVDSLPDVARGLTESDAWSRLAGPLGLSSQLEYTGQVADLFGRVGLGPNDAVALGRAQLALVVTGLEAGAEPAAEGSPEQATLVVKPRFALVVKTHTSAGTARDLAASRLPMFARRAYGEATPIDESEYSGAHVSVARGPGPNRQIVWAVIDDMIVVGNNEEPVHAVLDAAARRAPSLAGNFYLEKLRGEVDAKSALVFAYVSKSGVGRLVGVGPGIVAGSITSDPDRAASVSQLVGSVAEGAVEGFGYAGSFVDGRFVDRYYAMLAPRFGDTAAEGLKTATGNPEALKLVPAGVAEANLVRIQRPGETVDALMTSLSSRLDVGVAAAMTQIAIELRRSYGVEPDEPVSPALGDQILFVDFGEGAPMAAAFEVRDSARLLGVVERYLKRDGAHIVSESYHGVDILKSSSDDAKAAAIVGRYLIFGTRDQIARMADARGGVAAGATVLAGVLEAHSPALVATERSDTAPASELLLALSATLRTTDGSTQVLARPEVQDALAGMAPATSWTELRDGGLYTESRSAVGNLTYLTVFLGGA